MSPRARILVWPESSSHSCGGKPLEPDEPGWIVGWKLEAQNHHDGGGTVMLVCAGIVSAVDKECLDPMSTCRFVVGWWEPANMRTTMNVSRTKKPLPCFVATDDGPWWAAAADEEDDASNVLPQSEQSRHHQLLLYRPGVLYPTESTDDTMSWMSGFWPRLMWHLNEATSLVDRIQQDESTSNAAEYAGGVKVEEAAPSGSLLEPNDERDECERMEEGHSSLWCRLSRFVTGQSMLSLHWRTVDRSFYQIPLIHLLCLVLRPLDKSAGTRKEKVDAHVVRFNQMVSVSLNLVIGVAAGLLIFDKTDHVLSFLRQAWRVCYEELLRDNIQWLERFPVGFKLNVPLTQNMGREITMLIGVHDSICDELWSRVSKATVLKAVGCTSIVFGFTALLALLHDILVLSTFHIVTVAMCFRAMHRTQLYLLASLWRLFRGKKKNVLRHRTDTMEYDSMQLLLGMILFTAVLFLFTTILVYCAFFGVLHLAIESIGVTLWFLYVTVRSFPLGTCFLRVNHPSWFIERVFLEEVASDQRIVTRLAPVHRSFVSIIADSMARYLITVLSSVPTFLWQLIAGKPCTIREVCVSL